MPATRGSAEANDTRQPDFYNELRLAAARKGADSCPSLPENHGFALSNSLYD